MSATQFSTLLWMLTTTALGEETTPPSFKKHVVVCRERRASEVGREILRSGGNAIDAATATAFALAVTHPAAGNIGGGGFIVVFNQKTGERTTFDFRETAPKAATDRMYLDPAGRLLPGHRAGVRAAGVPGTVRGLALALKRFGSKSWADLVRPAAKLAREGFAVDADLASSLNEQLQPRREGDRSARLADFPESIAAFAKPGGEPWREGDLLVQTDLADTLDRIAERGPDEFYEGVTADLIVDSMKKNGGLITREDLRSYRAIERPPIVSTFRGYDLFGVGPASSGGIVVAEVLNILEHDRFGRDDARSPKTIHRVAEAMRRAYRVRATELGDPDFVKIDTDRLISKKFAAELAETIGERATPSESLVSFPIQEAGESAETTHLSTIDKDGNAVSLTYTLEELYGSKATVARAGFLLNNEMGDFNLLPGRTDRGGHIGTKPNAIAPGKRMLSSQAPTIVARNGKVALVTGSPGGRTIPNTLIWVLLDFLAFDLKPLEAVAAPRTHHQWFPDVLTLEGKAWPESTLRDLRERGHTLRFVDRQGDAHTIYVEPTTGLRIGLADPRTQPSSAAAGD